MHYPAPLSRLLALLSLGFAAIPTQAAPDPLERTTPVPANEQIPILDFFRPPLFEAPDLNPGGTRFAALVSNDRDRTKLLIQDLESGKTELIAGIGDKDVYAYTWLTDDRLYYALARDKHWVDGHFVTDVTKPTDRYDITEPRHFKVFGVPEAKRMQPLVWDYDDHGPVRLNLHDDNFGGIRKRYPRPDGEGLVAGYSADSQGELLLGFTTKDGYNTVHCYVDERWVKTPIDVDTIEIIGAGDKHTELIVLGPRQPGKPRAVHRMDAVTGQLGEVLYQDEKYDLVASSLYRHPTDRRVLGIFCSRRVTEMIWLDEGYRQKQQAVKAALEQHFPGSVIHILGGDKPENRFFVATYSDRAPVTYHIVDFAKGSVGLIKNTRPWIDPARMQPMQVISYKARDGVSIEAYLTLPAGASKQKPAPLIVYPHGGPWVRDNWGWDPTVQFLASRGYAVFQPNYRGSLCYEWRIPEEDRFDFRKMHDDVTDGTRALIKSGLVDPDRIAILGWSFGAFLSLSGVAFEPDQYRCAATLSGVYDFEQVMKEERKSGNFSASAWLRRKIGDPKKQQEKFEAESPVRHVANIKVPIFVGHGRSDQVAEISQANRLIGELERHGVPYEKHIERSEGHGMAFTRNMVELCTKVEAFLAANMAPRPKPAAAP